jgi:hypothetical protein
MQILNFSPLKLKFKQDFLENQGEDILKKSIKELSKF